MNKQKGLLIEEIENLIKLGNELIEYGKSNTGYTADEQIKKFTNWTTRTGQFISKLYPSEDNQYILTFNLFRANMPMNSLHSGNYILLLEIIGILEAIKYELETGLIDNLRKLLQADIFSDFLEMGEYLLKEHYKDAVAVIIGAVLEDSLRKLAEANGISIINNEGKPLTIEPLNNELARKEIYNQLVKRQISSWAVLRNNAAHGHYDQYDEEQVKAMLLFVQKFSNDYLI